MLAYQPAPAATRATTLAGIALIHGLALAALVAMGGPAVFLPAPVPVEVRFLPAEHRPFEPPKPMVAKPTLRPVEISIPTVAPVEISPPHAPTNAITVAVAPTPPAAASASPALEAAPLPPRFDLAYLRNPAPAYPPLSRRLKEEGRVMLRVLVDARGEVRTVELANSSGHARLDQAAVTAVRHWRFTPARSGERAVDGWALVPIVFQLNA